ncbi:YdeI/OmpD-associated family protein [Zhongshania marina]|uniref:DUF1905 domain-containing protein n=1 Tax=Zhongshania marina TaxID=2304603 RepID=A0ABX9W2S2_9GAMM|nr:DUF1905 domain-containing protein [Zhongshania marina]
MKQQFKEKLRRPTLADNEKFWAFVILPKEVSGTLAHRGRISVEASINNGSSFIVTLEPDGYLSHWLRISAEIMTSAEVNYGDLVSVVITPLDQEPEPEVPADFKLALGKAPDAGAVWAQTTVIARLDWIHWIESAKQSKTRAKRIADACDMLSSGKRRVCCFDQSGFYSKALRAPKEAS